MGKVIDNRLDAFNVVFSPSISIQQTYNNSLQYKINDEFALSSDVYVIQEEQTFGMLDWQDVTVRICHVLTDKQTGQKLGDDYKEIIFQDIEHAYGMGKRYKFDNNIWITVNSDLYHYVTASCIIRRCNNLLRFKDKFGNKIQEPCIIDYQLRTTTNDFNNAIITPQGMIQVTCQNNDIAKNIYENQRFLFGNPRKAWKIRGGGINNYLNQNTYDDSSAPLIKIDMDINEINNATDDIEGGYADANQINYTISIDQGTSLEQNINYSGTLSATVKLNGNIISDIPLVWASSDETIVSTQQNGNFINFELLQEGMATISVSMQNNPLVKTEIDITVNQIVSDVYEVRIADNITEILQGQSNTYSVYLYQNNIQQSNTFTITASGVPIVNYKLTIIDGNHFKVDNLKMYSSSPLLISCTSGEYEESISINLKGVW